MQKILLIVNKKASQGEGSSDQIKKIFMDKGLSVVESECQSIEDYKKIINSSEKFDAIVVGGGDGTVRIAAEAVMGTNIPLGIIPLGTANNVARSLFLPLTIPEACDTILQKNLQPMDLAQVNKEIFVSVIGIGLSKIVHEETPSELKKRWGAFSYLFQAFKSLKKLGHGFRAHIKSVEETVTLKAAQITVCNGRFYGAHLEVSKDASISDGFLDVSIVEAKKYFLAFFKYIMPWDQDAKSQGLKLLRGKSFEINTIPKMKVDVEGGSQELFTPVIVEILPAALEVFTPQATSADS